MPLPDRLSGMARMRCAGRGAGLIWLHMDLYARDWVMIGRATTCAVAVVLGLLLGAAGTWAQSPQGNAAPQSPELRLSPQQPAPPPGMFVWPTRPAPQPAPQQGDDGQGCTYRENKLELIV